MNIEEIMIGDWVYDDREIAQKIISTEDSGILAITSNKEGLCRITRDDNVEPIPITPEILEKNGFEYDKFIDNLYSNDSLNDRPLFIEPANGAFEICVMNVYVKIKYVHELQHAMRLCGIDKEIKLCD